MEFGLRRLTVRLRPAHSRWADGSGATIAAFRGAPQTDTAENAGRIFDALNWALGQRPDMALATSGAKGGEQLAIKWAKRKGVTLVLARADFDRNGRAAPFRANDELLELKPVCVLTLANSINAVRGATLRPFSPALNLAEKAGQKGIRHHPVRARAWSPACGGPRGSPHIPLAIVRSSDGHSRLSVSRPEIFLSANSSSSRQSGQTRRVRPAIDWRTTRMSSPDRPLGGGKTES